MMTIYQLQAISNVLSKKILKIWNAEQKWPSDTRRVVKSKSLGTANDKIGNVTPDEKVVQIEHTYEITVCQ